MNNKITNLEFEGGPFQSGCPCELVHFGISLGFVAVEPESEIIWGIKEKQNYKSGI